MRGAAIGQSILIAIEHAGSGNWATPVLSAANAEELAQMLVNPDMLFGGAPLFPLAEAPQTYTEPSLRKAEKAPWLPTTCNQ